jgi:hypothetical protein
VSELSKFFSLGFWLLSPVIALEFLFFLQQVVDVGAAGPPCSIRVLMDFPWSMWSYLGF